MKKLGLYIHIPFCIQKCYYCDFNSYAGLEALRQEYVGCLKKEMHMYKERLGNRRIDTVYIGGGTPSCLPESSIMAIMDACAATFNLSAHCEISVESNPGTLSGQKLRAFKACGINRLSIGLQSWHDADLKRLGRIHTQRQFVDNFDAARQAGFDNINIDLMFALPSQTPEQWGNTLDNIILLQPEHISCYSLKIEESTRFYTDYHAGRLKLPDEETDRHMYHQALQKLAQHHYRHYEISNFAKTGFECRHNLIYWKCKDYVGIGAGAHSCLDGERYSNICVPAEYIMQIQNGSLPIAESTVLEVKDRMAEFIFLGLRLSEGISAQTFYDAFQTDIRSVFGSQIDKFIRLGLMKRQKERYQLTAKGMDVSNQIFIEFI